MQVKHNSETRTPLKKMIHSMKSSLLKEVIPAAKSWWRYLSLTCLCHLPPLETKNLLWRTYCDSIFVHAWADLRKRFNGFEDNLASYKTHKSFGQIQNRWRDIKGEFFQFLSNMCFLSWPFWSCWTNFSFLGIDLIHSSMKFMYK